MSLVAPEVSVESGDLIATLTKAGSYGRYLSMIDAAGMTPFLRGPDGYTLLAPTDDVFDRMPAGTLDTLLKPESRPRLVAIVKYSIFLGPQRLPDLVNTAMPVSYSGLRATVSSGAGQVSVDRARVVRSYVGATNGVIHAVDSINVPPELDLVNKLAACPAATIFSGLVAQSDVRTTLGILPSTVLAPSDDALGGLPPETLATLKDPANRDKLAAFLRRHILVGRVFAQAALDRGSIASADGRTIAVTGDPSAPRFNGVKAVRLDMTATNGVVHVLDGVLPDPAAISAGR